MSTDPSAGPSDAGASQAPGQAQGQPSEAELRAAYEAELSRITSAELMLQAAVSLLNVGSFRLAPRAGAGEGQGAEHGPGGELGGPSGADLEQARDAIDGARALLEILERSAPSEVAPLRNALSQLQMAYARAVQAAGAVPAPPGEQGGGGAPPSGGEGGGETGGAPGTGEAGGGEGSSGPGPAESSGRLWVPGR
jgi:hypothetical protein